MAGNQRSPPSPVSNPQQSDAGRGLGNTENIPPTSTHGNNTQPSPTQDQSDPGNQWDIKIEYHPHSKRRAEHLKAHQFRRPQKPANQASQGNKDSEKSAETSETATPWHPFRSRLDFEISDFVQGANLNSGQIERLLALMTECADNPTSFTLSGNQDLKNLWDLSRTLTEGFSEHTYTCEYKGEDREYVVWSRSLWEWCTELLSDKHLIEKFHWDAEKVSVIFDQEAHTLERRIDEPWTADAWWDIQTSIPSDAKPFCILLYADKTHLSSFGASGGQKGYPVLARCANLPVELRNSDGIGGSRLVGWLPVVPEDAGETGKTKFVDLKRVVWHKGFEHILESIKDWTKTGCVFTCADGVRRLLVPIILILSADYEEQCIMAAMRGNKGLYPCPICLVHADDQCDLSKDFILRTTESMQSVYNESQSMNASGREELLKSYSLRNVKNIFWDMRYTDVYSALSWDRLHAYHGGLFKDHLWKELKEVINETGGKPSAKIVETQFNSIPPYSGLTHFTSVMKIDFADGSKWEDISKIIVYASHNVLTSTSTKRGYHLLKLIRSYLELDMYASLTVHTDRTIAAGREELQKYNTLLQEYIAHYETKSWNFPKSHSHIHMFDDILRKGVTRNFNSKINEKRHSPLKKYYSQQVNFKDVGAQILRLDHNSLASLIITRNIEVYDSRMESLNQEKASELYYFGSALPKISLAALEAEHMTPDGTNLSFRDLRKKVAKALSRECGRWIRLDKEKEVQPFRLLKVDYTCAIDSTRVRRDILHVHPNFYRQKRNDYVLLRITSRQFIFARLLQIFSTVFEEKTYFLALVLPLDRPAPATNRNRDRDLRFIRVRSRPASEAVIINTDIIERGALLVPEFGSDYNDSFIAMEVADNELWFRIRTGAATFVSNANI
ncbi:hypothetical protein CPC08DRAFT_651734 [Agrocybe pediades]|nr:hypothetical protein CPC08DRAFT_651734 [Agrocybe pediades]